MLPRDPVPFRTSVSWLFSHQRQEEVIPTFLPGNGPGLRLTDLMSIGIPLKDILEVGWSSLGCSQIKKTEPAHNQSAG